MPKVRELIQFNAMFCYDEYSGKKVKENIVNLAIFWAIL